MDNYFLKYSIYIFEDNLYNLIHSKFGIKIIMHTKEKGHKKPHVHVQYGKQEAALSLVDGEFLEGNIHPKKQKYAKEWVLDNKEELLKRYKEIIIL